MQLTGENEHRAGAPSPVRRSDSMGSRGSTPNSSAHYEKIVFEAVIEKVNTSDVLFKRYYFFKTYWFLMYALFLPVG